MAETSVQGTLGAQAVVPVYVQSCVCKMVEERNAEACDLLSWEPALYESCKMDEALQTGNARQKKVKALVCQ